MASWGRWPLLVLALGGSPHTHAGTTATIALSVSPAAAVAPASVQLTAAVSGTSLSGSIAFNDGTSVIGTAPIKHNKAVLATALDVGIHRITAAYTGGGKAIESPTVNVVVDNAPTCE